MKTFREIFHILLQFILYLLNGCCVFQVRQNSSKFVPIDTEWTVVKRRPPEPLEHFELRGLEPETDYQLVMRVENELGWSNYSSSYFVFHMPQGILLLSDLLLAHRIQISINIR